MSFSRWFVCASFASGLMAFTLHTAGIAKANPSTLTDGSYAGNQVGQQGAGNPSTGNKGTTNAESSMRMQSEKNSPSGEPLDPKDPKNTMGQSGPEQRDTKSGVMGREDSSTGRSNPTSPSYGSGSMGGGSGMSGSGSEGVAR